MKPRKIRKNKKLQLVYGKMYGVIFTTFAPSPTAYMFRHEIKGRYNLKIRKKSNY